MVKIELPSQRGPTSTGSGRKGLDLEKNYVASISKTKTGRAVNTNRKS